MGDKPFTKDTPLESFINHKNETGMQCGNYTIDIPELKPGEQYRFHFDATACVGCHCCEVACNEQNGNSPDIKWRRVGEMEMGEFPDTLQLFNSMSCNHCIDPECLRGCPTESYIKLDNGIVWHDDPSCIGCQYCTWNCPYEVPVFNPDRGIVTKCHMCVDKLEAGQTPACVQACPGGAIEIEAVNVEKWLDEGMAKEGVAPHLPDIAITKPTTRYTLPEIPEGEEIRVADEHLLKPAHSELPLVFMTVLTQVSLGAFLALFLGQMLYTLGFNLPRPTALMAVLAFLPAAIGLPLSALHLGRPGMAMMAMKNWRTSWLSREAIALGAFTGMATVTAGLYLIHAPDWLLTLFEALTLGVGIYGIYAQSMIYRIKARPSWNRKSTTKRFFGSGYVGFLLIAMALLATNGTEGATVLLAVTLLAGMGQALVILEEVMFYRHLDKEDPLYYQLNRTRILLQEHFGKVKKFRIYSLAAFALALPLLAILFVASGLSTLAMTTLILATIGAFTSEIAGRYLFYRTVVPLGLAGNFFAGNQRH
ncbi:MAG: dimethyl sulfoxide reductase anchor subunit [Sulfurovum sp.]|nr:dimethyl sulfoxide reductase anchor subunit [Sulfurovum sp.]